MSEEGPTLQQRRLVYGVLSALLILIVALNVIVFWSTRSPSPPRPTATRIPSPQVTVPPASPSPSGSPTLPASPTRPVTPPPTLPRHTATPSPTTARPSPTRTRTPTVSPSPSPTLVTPTATPTISPTATLTPTPTPFPTWTPTVPQPTATPEPTRTPGPISASASRVTAEPTDSPWRWRIRVRVIDIYGLPAAGVQVQLSFVPASAPVVVEDPPPTDADGVTVGYVQSDQAVCVIVEARVGDVVLLEKPTVCFGP